VACGRGVGLGRAVDVGVGVRRAVALAVGGGLDVGEGVGVDLGAIGEAGSWVGREVGCAVGTTGTVLVGLLVAADGGLAVQWAWVSVPTSVTSTMRASDKPTMNRFRRAILDRV